MGITVRHSVLGRAGIGLSEAWRWIRWDGYEHPHGGRDGFCRFAAARLRAA